MDRKSNREFRQNLPASAHSCSRRLTNRQRTHPFSSSSSTGTRLTANEFAAPPAAIDCYKSLYHMHLSSQSHSADCYPLGSIRIDFEGVWAQPNSRVAPLSRRESAARLRNSSRSTVLSSLTSDQAGTLPQDISADRSTESRQRGA